MGQYEKEWHPQIILKKRTKDALDSVIEDGAVLSGYMQGNSYNAVVEGLLRKVYSVDVSGNCDVKVFTCLARPR
jgi:hypothetical protein